jgi:hypothetical protein
MITNTHSHEKIVERWMLTIVSDGGVRRNDDLHIDRIDPAWKSRQQWIEGGLEALRVALTVRDRTSCHSQWVLVFHWSLAVGRSGSTFMLPKGFAKGLVGHRPLYNLFHRGQEPDKQVISDEAIVRDLSPAIIGAEVSARCYYLEFRGGGADEYYRSVFVEG